MYQNIEQKSVELELICGYSKKLNGLTMRFPTLPMTGDKIKVEGKNMLITARCWDHSVDPPIMRLEVHLDH